MRALVRIKLLLSTRSADRKDFWKWFWIFSLMYKKTQIIMKSYRWGNMGKAVKTGDRLGYLLSSWLHLINMLHSTQDVK